MSDESSIFDGYEMNPAGPATGPRAGVWLSARDPVAQDLLLEYARRLRAADPGFSRDLEAALDSAGSAVGSGPPIAASIDAVLAPPDEAGPRRSSFGDPGRPTDPESSTRLDRGLSAELIAQAREDDGRMIGGSWRAVGFGVILEIESSLTHQDGANVGVAEDIRRDDALGICRTRNNLRRMADQLEAAIAEVSRLDGMVRASAGERRSARSEIAGLRRDLRRDQHNLRGADLELEVTLESLSWATSALAYLTREVVGHDAAKEQAARISAGIPSSEEGEVVPLSRRDLDTMEYAARIDERFGAGIFPRGAGQRAHFRRLVRLGMIALDSRGRDVNGEVEHDVTICRLTSEGRKIVQDAVLAAKE